MHRQVSHSHWHRGGPLPPLDFTTASPRRIEDFAGIGHLTGFELGLGYYVVGVGQMVLPEGTWIGGFGPDSVSTAVASSYGVGVFSLITLWVLLDFDESPT